MSPLQVKDGKIVINVTVVPKSSRDAIVGILGDSVKVAVTAPPVDGKANAYVCKFLAGEFKTAKSNVSIIKGETSKHKTIEIREYRNIPPILREFVTDSE